MKNSDPSNSLTSTVLSLPVSWHCLCSYGNIVVIVVVIDVVAGAAVVIAKHTETARESLWVNYLKVERDIVLGTISIYKPSIRKKTKRNENKN